MSQAEKILSADFEEVGYLKKTKGFEGYLTIQFLKKVNHDYSFGFIILKIDGNYIPFKIKDISISNDKTGIISFFEIKNFEEAKALIGTKVYFEKHALISESHNNENDEVTKFIGYLVIDSAMTLSGRVTEVVFSKFQTKILVETSPCNQILIPFEKAFISSIDNKNQTIHVILPKGYLELFSNEK